MRPEGAPHTAPSRGMTCVLAAPPPAHAGGIASSEERGFPPHISHLRACVSQDRGRIQRPPHWPKGAPGGSIGLAPRGPLCGIPWRAAPGLGPHRGPGEPPPPGHTKRSPSLGGPDYSGVPRAPFSARGGTAPRVRVRGSSPIFAELVPRPRVGLIGLLWGPVSRGPMASADAAHGTAAMAVDCRGGAPGDVLGEEEEIDGTLASLLSASWPTPAVVDDSFRRFPWDLGGSLVEQRYAVLEGRRMVSLWTTIRANYGPLYAVPEGTTTDFPFLRRQKDWRVCRVLRHLAKRDLPPEVGDKPYFSWDYYFGTPPKIAEEDRGYFVPGALGEWTIRTTMSVLVLHEQWEVREVPVSRREALYPIAPLWWASVEVPRGMAARMPQMLGLRGSKLIGEVLGGPYHIMMATLWAVEVADVFVGSIRHHGHLWRLPLVLRTALAELTAERLCSADSSARPLLEAGFELLRLVEELGRESWLLYDASPRGVFRCAKVLDDDGVLVLMEGLGDSTLPYGRSVTHELRLCPLDRDLATAGPNRYGPAALLAPPAARPPSPPASSEGVPHLAPPLWGAVSSRYTPRWGGRYGRSRRTHPGGWSVPFIGGRSGPPLASLPLFSWDGAGQLGTPRPVRRAVCDGLARSRRTLPPILTNGMDHTLMI